MDYPTTRVLTVLELLQTYGQVSGPDVARRLGVSECTVRHYIALLRELGYPVETARGRYGAYRLRPGAKLPPLMLAEDEGLALVVGLLAARRLGLSAAVPAIEGALAKLGRLLPVGVRERARALEDGLALGIGPAEGAPGAAVLLTLSEAAQRRRRVRLRYQSGRAEESARAVDPYGLACRQGRHAHWYLVGYDHLRGEARTFRVDRVRAAELREETFAAPEGFDALAQVDRSLATIPGAWSVEALPRTTLGGRRVRRSRRRSPCSKRHQTACCRAPRCARPGTWPGWRACWRGLAAPWLCAGRPSCATPYARTPRGWRRPSSSGRHDRSAAWLEPNVQRKIEGVRICCMQGARLPLSPDRESELSPWLNKRLFLNR
jgi:predicted DNA-binding transcriptional regulator YafY